MEQHLAVSNVRGDDDDSKASPIIVFSGIDEVWVPNVANGSGTTRDRIMLHEQPPEIESILSAAIDKKSTKERHAYLDGACGNNAELRDRVEALIRAHDEAGTNVDESPSDSARTLKKEMGGEKPGTVIGRYKVLQKIGEGGFGVVYMAEQQEPVIRKVALKIIKLGMDTKQVIGRFEAERVRERSLSACVRSPRCSDSNLAVSMYRTNTSNRSGPCQ